MTDIQTRLFEMRDLKYRDFHSRLMPTVDKDLIIGVRTPALRKFANELSRTDEAFAFLRELPHKYYEENNLHAFIIEKTRNYDELIAQLDTFLPFVDNWATCDMMAPTAFKKNLGTLTREIHRWISSEHLYTVRFAIVTLMKFYLDDNFSPDHLELCANVVADEYYLSMAVAWYFATALAKQWDAASPYIMENRLDTATHNRAIQKACDSFRISTEQKQLLRTYRKNKRAA